jgi:folylpolyglutamate synthase/dihydropteroate synthase
MEPDQIAELLGDVSSAQGHRDITQSVAEAITRALAVAQPEDIICVTGSLYVVAEARQCLLEANQVKATTQAFRP